MTQKYQYIHPVRKPASLPGRACRQRQTRVFVKRAHRRHGARHFSEHAHDEHDQTAGNQKRQNCRRAGLPDHDAAADKQARADHAAQRDHGHVALLEAGLQFTLVRYFHVTSTSC
jgi:hypothetical protein